MKFNLDHIELKEKFRYIFSYSWVGPGFIIYHHLGVLFVTQYNVTLYNTCHSYNIESGGCNWPVVMSLSFAKPLDCFKEFPCSISGLHSCRIPCKFW